MPMAPPRLLDIGFVDNHTNGLITLAANPYAAMPSLHACDSLIVGIILFRETKHWWAKAFWVVWPAWVWFAVVATGNHFLLDCVVGMFVAFLSLAIVYERLPVVPFFRRRLRVASASSAS
jgi:membrane-associated phospholipid phosphatase